MKKLIALLLATTMVLGMVACAPATDVAPEETAPETTEGTAPEETTPEDLHFVYVSPLLSHPIWLIAKDGFDVACEELGITGDWVGPQGVSAEEMAQLVDTAVAQKADGIITQSICPAAPINTAIEKGVPVILVDGDLADVPDKLAFLGKDLNKQAELFYEEATKYIADDEKIVASIQCAALNAQIYVDQNEAVVKAFENHPGGFELVNISTSDSDKAKAITEWQNTLNTYPEINVAINVAGEAGAACALVLKELGRDQVVNLAVDNTDETMDLLASGDIDGTVVSSFFNYGYQAAYWLYQNVTEGRTPTTKSNDAGTYMVTIENMETYNDLLTQKVDLPA